MTREEHIEFILNDTKERGEIIASGIKFMGAIYQCKVKKEGDKRRKTVMYSAARKILDGYREIKKGVADA